MQDSYTFEICTPNIQSAISAQQAGAHRIELCSALDAGGVTPSSGLIQAAVTALNIPVNVLIRPREGDFCYSKAELDIMLSDIKYCHAIGVNGVVVGALLNSGELDIQTLKAMKAASGDMEVVHHRAFDFSANPETALEQLIELGFHRVLSSGQADSAFEGRFLLQKLVQQAKGRISIMPGAGINRNNIAEIAQVSAAHEFHFTGKLRVASTATNAIQGLDASYWQSDAGVIREIMEAIK